MKLDAIDIRGLRNIERVTMSPAPGLNIIYGSNGAGKTNILEAIHLLATGRSFRTRHDRELIRWEGARKAEFAVVMGQFALASGSTRNARVVVNDAQKRIFLNDKQVATMAAYWGELNAVVFTPDDLQIVKGDPAARRAFLDAELSQISSAYLASLQNYHKALRQRNALLRTGRSLDAIAPQLEVWERTMAEHAAEIYRERLLRLAQLETHTAELYRFLTDEAEDLKLRYLHFLLPHEARLEQEDKNIVADGTTEPRMENLAETIAAIMAEQRREDFDRGFSAFGPHRDDFHISIEGLNARRYSSQGQQRSSILALRLAELRVFKEVKGEHPIVMLDDISSELDDRRRSRLSEALPADAQTFVTTVSPKSLSLPADLGRALFQVRHGTVELM